MSEDNWKSIDQLFDLYLKTKPGLQTKLQVFTIKKMIKNKFGDVEVNLKDKTLFIRTKNPTLRQELLYKKDELKNLIKTNLGDVNSIEDIEIL